MRLFLLSAALTLSVSHSFSPQKDSHVRWKSLRTRDRAPTHEASRLCFNLLPPITAFSEAPWSPCRRRAAAYKPHYPIFHKYAASTRSRMPVKHPRHYMQLKTPDQDSSNPIKDLLSSGAGTTTLDEVRTDRHNCSTRPVLSSVRFEQPAWFIGPLRRLWDRAIGSKHSTRVQRLRSAWPP